MLSGALLQRAELVVLDESFAVLDPESLRQALKLRARAGADVDGDRASVKPDWEYNQR